MIDDPDVVTVEVPSDPDLVEIVVSAEIEMVEVVVEGPQGPAAPPAVSSGLEVRQDFPSGTWIIRHAFGRRPAVAVYDATGAEMIADVEADETHATITHANPTTGFVVLI